MPRKPLPPDKLKETVGVKLDPKQILQVKGVAARYDKTESWAGRQLMALGYALYETLQSQGIELVLEGKHPRNPVLVITSTMAVPGVEVVDEHTASIQEKGKTKVKIQS